VTVVPYLMAAGLNGTVGARGFDTNINASVSDVLSHLEFGAVGIVAAHKGAWERRAALRELNRPRRMIAL